MSPKYLWREEGEILDLDHENGNNSQNFQVKAGLSLKLKSVNSSSDFKMWNLGGLCHPVHDCCSVWNTKVYLNICFQIFSSGMEATIKIF